MKKNKVLAMSVLVAVLSTSVVNAEAKWKKNETGYWLENEDKSYPRNKWEKVDGKWYYFDNRGYMVTGWKKIGGQWYFLKSSGAMAESEWAGDYYLTSSGAMATDVVTPDGYTVDKNGKWDRKVARIVGKWVKENDRWWYKNADGSYPKNKWQKINDQWFYFDEEGYMKSDSWVGDYYVGKDGAMLSETTTPDGKKVDKNGKVIVEEKKEEEEEQSTIEEKYVEIEDALLLKVINKNIDKNRADDRKITVYEMKNLKELSIFLKKDGKPDFSENAKGSILGEPKSLTGTPDFKFAVTRGIKSIKGLEHAVNLEKLKLNENEIKDLSPLKDLTKLKYLELQRNRIVDLKPLANLTNLEFLKLYNNLIEDITPLEKLVNLTGLDLHYNVKVEGDENNKKISKGITDISVVKNMTKLEFLDVSANRIKDVSVIKNLEKINDIDFSGNNVSSYENLEDYIFERYVKQDNGDGSIGWFGQTVDFGKTEEVTSKTFTVKSPFKGIKSLSKKFAEGFGEDSINLFDTVEASKEGISVRYIPEDETFEFKLSDEFVKENNKKEVSTDLKISFADFNWKIKDVKLNLNIDENPVVVNDQNKDFYYKLFNDYSKANKKYRNLTDEANAKLKGKAPLKSKEITAEDMKMLKSFKVSDRKIDDNLLAPLKYAENLEEFEVLLNSANLTREAKDFSVLEKTKITKFWYLNQDYDNLDHKNSTNRLSADFSPLSKVKTLKDVRINFGDLKNLNSFKDLDLTTLVLEAHQIDDISAVSTMKNIERFEVTNNKITDIKPLANLPKLITLYLANNPVADISSLGTVKTLEALVMPKTKIANVEILKELPNLHRLRIDKNAETLEEDYFEDIREIKTLNEIRVSKINPNDFEWLKTYLIRNAVDATFPEDRVRIGYFDELTLEVEVDKKKVVDGKVEIENPLKDWKGVAVPQDEYSENQNENVTFEGDKISIKVESADSQVTESYDIYIENQEHTFEGQAANLSGKVKIKLNFVEGKTVDKEKETGLPRAYDLRDVEGKNFVTSVKNQYKDGGCRSFASLGALESHILMKTGHSLDLSENNMEVRHGYYYNGKPSPENARMGRTRESDIGYLISDKGPYLEKDDEYRPFLQEGLDIPNGIDKKKYYADLIKDEEDYSPGPAKGIITNKNIPYRVTGFEFLKTIDTTTLTSEEDSKLAQIKTAIMANGAVVTDIYISHDGNKTFPYTNATYYNKDKFAYYTDGKDGKYQGGANHAVTIVGWDDNFSKENFVTKPPIDGAWIVKDSQGEIFGDKGFYYVSFASVSMTQNPYVFTNVVEGNVYKKIYQHDDIPFSGYIQSNNYSDGKTILLNVYKSKEAGEVLTDIGFFTTKPDAEYEVYLIPDFKAFKSEAEGFSDFEEYYEFIKDYKVFSGTQKKAGYHVMQLQKELDLIKNQDFAIGIWTKNPNSEDSIYDMVVETSKIEAGFSGYGRQSNQLQNETFTFGFDGFIDLNVRPHNEKINASVKGYVKTK